MKNLIILARCILCAMILGTCSGCACTGIVADLGWCTPDRIKVTHHCHSIHVSVVDKNGKPVSSGQVKWHIHASIATPWHNVDSSGQYTFTDLPGTNTSNGVQYRASPSSTPTPTVRTNPLDQDKSITIQLQ